MDTKRDADIATYGCGPLQPVTRNTDAGGPGQNNMLFVLFILDLFTSKRKQTMKKKKVSRIVVATHRGLWLWPCQQCTSISQEEMWDGEWQPEFSHN